MAGIQIARITPIGFIAALVATTAVASPRPDLATDLQTISSNFVCPEKLGNDDDRKLAMEVVGRKLAAHRLSYAQAQKIVATLYSLHGCGVRTETASAAVGSAAITSAAP